MKQPLAVLLIVAGLYLPSSPVLAVDIYESAGYLGGAVSITRDNNDSLENIAKEFGITRDDSDTGLQLFAGYRFNRYFAVEAKFAGLGEYAVSNCCDKIEVEARAFSLDAAFIIPFGEYPFDLQAQAGVAIGDVKISSNFGINESSSDFGGHAGLALRWHASQKVTMRAAAETWVFDTNDITDITVNALSVGAQVNFR